MLEKADETVRAIKATAHLSMTTNKKSVYVGECLTLTLAFNVHDHNKVPLQFVDLGFQLIDMKPALTPDNCWITRSTIMDVVAEAKIIDDENFSTYAFYKASYCPVAAGVITIPAVKLKLAGSDQAQRVLTRFWRFPVNHLL